MTVVDSDMSGSEVDCRSTDSETGSETEADTEIHMESAEEQEEMDPENPPPYETPDESGDFDQPAITGDNQAIAWNPIHLPPGTSHSFTPSHPGTSPLERGAWGWSDRAV